MKSIIKNTINSCFIVWLKIFKPIENNKKLVIFTERFDTKDKK